MPRLIHCTFVFRGTSWTYHWQPEVLQRAFELTFKFARRRSPLAGATVALRSPYESLAAAPEVANLHVPSQSPGPGTRRASARGHSPQTPSEPGAHHPAPRHGQRNAHTARDEEGERGGRDSPFCSLVLDNWNLLLGLDSACVPGWPARADVSRRSLKRSIWLTGARAHSRRALGKQRLQSLSHRRQGKAALGWTLRACSGSRESQGSFHIIPSKTFS